MNTYKIRRNQYLLYISTCFRVTVNEISTYAYLDYNINEHDWDNIPDKLKNLIIILFVSIILSQSKKAEYKATLINIQTNEQILSAKYIKLMLTPNPIHSFFVITDLCLRNIKEDEKYDNWNGHF